MKANELRIGNLGYDVTKGRDVEIIGIDSTWNDVWVRYGNISDYKIDINDFIPLDLTEELLLKFGFTKRTPMGYYFDLGRISVNMPDFEYKNTLVDIKIRSVHQLQNLYFALTGEELTIKE